MVKIQDLFDDAKCYQNIREMRWPDGEICTRCSSDSVIKNGRDDTQPDRQRHECRDCRQRFEDLTDTIFAGHHQPLRTWIACLYLMGLNLSGLQIAGELEINDARAMIGQFRQGIVDRRPPVVLEGEVESDEVYVVAGHKDHPEAVKKGGLPRRRRLKGERGRGTLAKEKPPIFGMLQRGGEVVIRMLANVNQTTIGPLIERTIAKGTLVYTDEHDTYSRLVEWGYDHETVSSPPETAGRARRRVFPSSKQDKRKLGCGEWRLLLILVGRLPLPPPNFRQEPFLSI